MDYLFIILPMFIMIPLIISNLVIVKAVKKLDSSHNNKYVELKKQNSKKRLYMFLFFPFFFLLKDSIERILGIEYLSISVILFVLVFMLFFFINELKIYRFNKFPKEFINTFKKSEYIKIGGFILSILVLVFSMFYFLE